MDDASGGGAPDVILMASGSEVALALEAHERLVAEGVRSRLVNMASMRLFEQQDADYREGVLPLACSSRLAVEAGVTFGWDRWVGAAAARSSASTTSAPRPRPARCSRSSASPPTTSTRAPRPSWPEARHRPAGGAAARGAARSGLEVHPKRSPRARGGRFAFPAGAVPRAPAGGIDAGRSNSPGVEAYDVFDCVRSCSTMNGEREGQQMSPDVPSEIHEMIPAERRARIVELLEERRAVRVSVLSETLGVSEMTIRRDLEQLEQAGLLSRTHGGRHPQAAHARGAAVRHQRARPLGGEAAHRQGGGREHRAGRDGLPGSGTTAAQVLSHVDPQLKARIVTHNVGALSTAQHSALDVVPLGGSYRSRSNTLEGRSRPRP